MAHYVDGPTLTSLLSSYATECRTAEATGQPHPAIPDALGRLLLLITQRIALRVSDHHLHDDLVGDALLHLVTHVHRFDPTRTQNGFGFITKAVFNAVHNSIETDRAARYKLVRLAESYHERGYCDMHDYLESQRPFAAHYEERKRKKAERKARR